MVKPKQLKRPVFAAIFSCAISLLNAQVTAPVNGVADSRTGTVAFTNATIIKDANTTITNATLLIKNGKVVSIGSSVSVPKDAVVVNCSGKFIYPSLIDIYSDYGIEAAQRQTTGGGAGFFGVQQTAVSSKGISGWNPAIKSEQDAVTLFSVNEAKAKVLRDGGFGTVLTHQKDGIARGTGTVVSLANKANNLVVLKEKASAHYSFSKGTSPQSYPASMMGAVALLRQTYLDAKWYKLTNEGEGLNMSLQAWNNNQQYPQFFEATDKWSAVRADRIGDEFGVQYIIKAGSNEYQRINEIAATKASFVLSLDFPAAQDVENPEAARFVSLTDLKHWELAPTNPSAFEKANIPFALTTAGVADVRTFWTNLRKAIAYGLTEKKALEALTVFPARLLGIENQVGSLDNGKYANFIITTGNLFDSKTTIIENWVQGEKYAVKADAWNDINGQYQLAIVNKAGVKTAYTLDVTAANAAKVIAGDTLTAKFSHDGKSVTINIPSAKRPNSPAIRLSGVDNGGSWQGVGLDTAGNALTWTAAFVQKGTVSSRGGQPEAADKNLGGITYPFLPYGNAIVPKQETILIKNATVWTNEKEGVLNTTDVLVRNGKIAQIGKNLSAAGAKVIDGTGKHLSAGIIDEHSHIAAFSINEGAQSVTSEVRIQDNLNPDDINIYRQLSGGVTTSHILHGSANTIGGQTQLIKLRWGADDKGLMFQNWDPQIKFALGENVKRSSSTQGNTRFPDTRMGVYEVLDDAFQRAKDYQNALKKGGNVRRDLELDALVEIMNSKRFITCHSYVASEIIGVMRIAEKYGFKVNTLTHILEGYKVADKIKEHGANVSTFSDWWAYKMEVQDAIAYNANIMQKVGLNVCINSDDAEMARRLNQEAAKVMRYGGGITEEDALKMVTLNPAKALHIEDRVGSIKVGKDADLVLWTDNPLSIYAVADYTIVDGTVFFDRAKDDAAREGLSVERNRLIQKMLNAGRSGAPTVAARPTPQVVLTCSEHDHNHGILHADSYEDLMD